jgi:hypothetical protein
LLGAVGELAQSLGYLTPPVALDPRFHQVPLESLDTLP